MNSKLRNPTKKDKDDNLSDFQKNKIIEEKGQKSKKNLDQTNKLKNKSEKDKDTELKEEIESLIEEKLSKDFPNTIFTLGMRYGNPSIKNALKLFQNKHNSNMADPTLPSILKNSACGMSYLRSKIRLFEASFFSDLHISVYKGFPFIK